MLLTWAQSADGYIASKEATRTPISCNATAELTQGLRATSDAVLVGVGTALADNPRLTVRSEEWKNSVERQPAAAILDSRLRTSPNVACISERCASTNSLTYIFVGQAVDEDVKKSPEWSSVLSKGSTRIVRVGYCTSPARRDACSNETAGLDLEAVLHNLKKEGVESVMVEGGCKVLTSFMEQGLGDFAIVTISPRFLAHGVQALRSASSAASQPLFSSLSKSSWVEVGEDIVLSGVLSR